MRTGNPRSRSSKKRKGSAKQEEIVFDEGKGLSTRDQQYDPTSIMKHDHPAQDAHRMSAKESSEAVDSAPASRRYPKGIYEPVSVNNRTGLRTAETEIGKSPAETGARNLPRKSDLFT
jgi:hypothetical protein